MKSRLEIRYFGKTNAYIKTVQKCKLCFPQNDHSDRGREREREKERERERQTDKKTDRQKNRDSERHKKTDRQTKKERERESLGKSLLCLKVIIDKMFYANSSV